MTDPNASTDGKVSVIVDLLKFPLLVFAILLSVVIAKRCQILDFGAVTEVSATGVKFSQQNQATLDALTNLEVKVNGALEEIKLLQTAGADAGTETPIAKASIFEAAQTVSDQTARAQS